MMNLKRIAFDYTGLDKQLLVTQSRIISIIQHRLFAKYEIEISPIKIALPIIDLDMRET